MSIGLSVLVAALAGMAIAASGAGATQVVPPSTAIEAESSQTLFLPENAYSDVFVKCTSSVARFETPAGRPKGGTTKVGIDQNINSESIGTHSEGSGGVTVDLTEPPSFGGCGVFEGPTELVKATVKTNSTNGNWSITANSGTTEEGSAAIGLPKEGALIETALGNIKISPRESSAVFAPSYVNATHALRVDSQLAFEGAGFVSPAQFEADYTADEELEILPYP